MPVATRFSPRSWSSRCSASRTAARAAGPRLPVSPAESHASGVAILARVPAILLACPECHRQYDVGAQEPGSKVRCLCGRVCEVARPRARQVEMLHCSNCGGKLESGKSKCEYRGAEVKHADRGLGPTCPECPPTTGAHASDCGARGGRLAPEGILRARSSSTCPRCRRPLSEIETASARYVECTGCAGLWLDEELFQRVAARKEAELASLFAKGGAPAPPLASLEHPVRYLPCPVCGEIMNRRNFADVSGVILDWCRGHGWWFDAHELE